MNEIAELQRIVKEAVASACRSLYSKDGFRKGGYEYSIDVPREMKAAVDHRMEEQVLASLEPVGLPVLSEESGYSGEWSAPGLRFVIDPLDGTVNYMRGLGPAAVSVALCEGEDPLFGAIGVYPAGDLAWGGREAGAFMNGDPIRVSAVSRIDQAVLCTGIPSRFRVNSNDNSARFLDDLGRYGKVRMLGAASVSLLQVARGAAEVYSEQEIMLWDVAAGVALVQGASGVVEMNPGRESYAFNVKASNGIIE